MQPSLFKIISLGIPWIFAPLQDPPSWEKHEFPNYRVEFSTPANWYVTINDNTEKSYLECYSPDNQVYFFLTTAENEKKSTNEVVLGYLKVTYANSAFSTDETKKINNIDFIFTNGVSSMNETKTFIRLGVGNHKNFIYMIDSGYSTIDSKEAQETLDKIIASLRSVD